MIAQRNPNPGPTYLTDHGAAVEEIGTLAQLVSRFIHATGPDARTDPTAPLELAILAQLAAQRPSVQSAAARRAELWECSCGCAGVR